MIENVCAPLKSLLKETLNTKIGICAREIELVETSSGKSATKRNNDDSEMIDDRFKLKIPLTNQTVTWEVIFNASHPNCPPDFDLNDLDFFYSLSADHHLPSLSQWNCRNKKALINVVTELRSAYLKYQVQRLDITDNRCAYEYASLIKDKRIPSDQIEVLVDTNAIIFLIRLEVNLPMVSDSPDDYTVALAIKYGAVASGRPSSIFSSPNIVVVLGSTLDLPRGIKLDESVADYAEEVARAAEEQALMVVMTRTKKRRQFMLEMMKHLGRWVVSYDALEYRAASFLLHSEGFVCVLEVQLPMLFPEVWPQYRLFSVYSTMPDNPLSRTLKMRFPSTYMAQAVENTLKFIYRELENFKAISVKMFMIRQ